MTQPVIGAPFRGLGRSPARAAAWHQPSLAIMTPESGWWWKCGSSQGRRTCQRSFVADRGSTVRVIALDPPEGMIAGRFVEADRQLIGFVDLETHRRAAAREGRLFGRGEEGAAEAVPGVARAD